MRRQRAQGQPCQPVAEDQIERGIQDRLARFGIGMMASTLRHRAVLPQGALPVTINR